MSASKPQKSEVRIEHSLNKKEKEFVARRRKDVLQSLKKLNITCSERKVPNIALLGSGGGERAMVGLLGSLDQLQKTGLLDCVLYLSGVSGSTWCMASLYQESDWSTKLETVKDKIVQRLSGPAVSWRDALAKLKKYHQEKHTKLFSLTDFWAVMFITTCVKEIDEHKLSEQRDRHKDPFPIYTAIDKHWKQSEDGDPWFEFTPYEAGYSLTGAFVETSDFGSKFENGRKIENQPEIDMLYLQALCGSALADEEEIRKFLWEKIKEVLYHLKPKFKLQTGMVMCSGLRGGDSDSPPIDKCYQDLMDLVDMNLSALKGKDPPDQEKAVPAGLLKREMRDYEDAGLLINSSYSSVLREERNIDLINKMSGGVPLGQLPMIDNAKQYMKQYTVDVFKKWSGRSFGHVDLLKSIFDCMGDWIWGRKYDFLYNMKDKAVHATRDYIDAGLLLNSPYFSVLREERNIDLIISLDFSDGDPFMTVRDAAETCKTRNIPFPEVNIPDEDVKKPKDFYVFKGKNTPTVIHIPLFNVGNCGDKIEEWRKKYTTFQGPYSAEMITDLMEVAGKNITNNKDNLLEEIRQAIKMHK
ncbi:cytosolic phospholipase A2 gamma-like isoform X2 [Siphateles boraxobius]|uniref:cytosolic phospholipase A2 gamma-like isoform X2 n=1 Tax=Siphateles boraxobius TaxID=180520 RepID=UPI004063463F